MYNLFFDLDDTILNLTHKEKSILNNYLKFGNVTEKEIKKAYGNISSRKTLKNLLQLIDNPKFILTNAKKIHAVLSLYNMDLLDNFNYIIDRDMVRCMKPNIQAYLLAMKMTGIKKPEECFLFDDQLPNLITAKIVGWNTIFIGNCNLYHNSVDFSFNNIYDALLFFLKN